MSVTPATIKAAVKTILSDASLTGASKVTEWKDAEPSPLKYPSNCFGWIEWAGGPEEDDSQDGTVRIFDNFYVVIVFKHGDADAAEDSATDLATTAEALLRADRTLSGQVDDSRISLREKQKIFQGDYNVNAVRLTLQAWRWLP